MEAREAIAEHVRRRRFSDRLKRRWLEWPAEDGMALLGLAEELRPSENHLREIMDWLEEIRLRDTVGPARLLSVEDIRRWIDNRRVSRADRLKRVKGCIWRRRFPRLSELESELEQAARELGLQGGYIRVKFPPQLEGDHLTFEMTVRSEAELNRVVTQLAQCIKSGGIERLFSRLREA